MSVCAAVLLAAAHIVAGSASEATGGGSHPSGAGPPAVEHELLWSAGIAVPDIFSIRLDRACLDPAETESAVGGDPTGVLVAVESRTARPRVELRDAGTGELIWRRLPGGVAGGSVFASAGPTECVVAAGSTLLIVDREGAGIASARLPGLLRSAAVRGGRACVCVGRPETGFSDSLAVFERRPRPGAVGHSIERVWSSELADHDRAFDDGFSRPVFGDTDGDGRDELVVIERMNEAVCRTSRGEELWRVVLGEKSRFKPIGVASADPVIADVTGDGITDVIVGCFAGAVVVLDGELGDEIARLQFGTEAHKAHLKRRRLSSFIREALASTGEPIGELLAVELDDVGGAELVFGCSDGFVYAVSPRNGERLWRFQPGSDVYDRPVVERGGAGRLVLWDEECLYVLDAATGAELTTLPRPSIAAAAVLGWSDGDVTVATADGIARNLEVWRINVPRTARQANDAARSTDPE